MWFLILILHAETGRLDCLFQLHLTQREDHSQSMVSDDDDGGHQVDDVGVVAHEEFIVVVVVGVIKNH